MTDHHLSPAEREVVRDLAEQACDYADTPIEAVGVLLAAAMHIMHVRMPTADVLAALRDIITNIDEQLRKALEQ